MPIIGLISNEADRMHDLLSKPELWNEEQEDIQKILKKLSQNTKVEKGEFFKLINEDWKLYPKPSERMNIIRDSHRLTGHSGLLKTIKKINENYYWESITFDVTDYINSCIICQQEKNFRPKT
jgi:hypothetical protein